EPALSAAIRTLVAELDVPLIGFAGAPFTLASYLIEGGPSRDFARTKALMLGDPATWDGLMDALLAVIEPHVRAQVTAGAAAVQIFDSWAGALSPAHYETSAAPYVRRLFAAIAGEGVPSISFGVGTSELLEVMRDAGGDAIGIDARTPLDRAWARLPGSAVQGNLDPAALLAPADVIERETLDVLARAGGRPGHVFNLGHGVLPATPVEALQRVVDVVHARTQRDG
ncbi:MAG TPA: uroporphyrinogen decarboxylase family protein, partial [Actinomycetota bacterium]|nr:uroporphyrinogen decarboxylase family protein [Actinomycetota bacterium]